MIHLRITNRTMTWKHIFPAVEKTEIFVGPLFKFYVCLGDGAFHVTSHVSLQPLQKAHAGKPECLYTIYTSPTS